jgi:putative sigma-54 modulation protein
MALVNTIAVKEELNMNVKITSKKMPIPQNFTEYAEKKLSAKLDKFFGKDSEAKVTMSEFKGQIVLEVTVKYDNMLYRAEQSAVDKEDALDASIDKIIRQIRKNKTRIEKRLKDTAFSESFAEPVTEQVNYDVIKHKKFQMRPMDVEEAILQMNMLGHTFFMFTNASTGSINVVYKRAEGNYAILEPADA